MRVSRNWLTKYVAIDSADRELADRLTMAGLEVESISSRAEGLDRIIVAEVVSVEPHPNANKLRVCRVFDGTAEVQVVCGAPNVAAGQKVAFAPVGASVPHNQHDPAGAPLTIGRVDLRGVESAGMICSGYELGIDDDHAGILVLDATARPGVSLPKQLGLDDTVFDIGVTANRPDLLSHIGVAREVGAVTGRTMKHPPSAPKESAKTAGRMLKVSVEDGINCPRYTARVVENVSVGQSPAWLRDALLSVGLRPVNNIVDVTNYVLMEIGQPLHAFDYDRIAGGSIIVRGGGEGSSFTTLDGKVRAIKADTLMICDEQGPVAIAGVMGGRNSEISDSTTTVVLESAYFNPISVRRTSKRLGLSTEASQRFERGADPGITAWAADRAARLLAEVAGGTVRKGLIDVYPGKVGPAKVRFDARNCDKLLGVTIGAKKASALFKSIGINAVPGRAGLPGKTGKAVKAAKEGKNVQGGEVYVIPTWRPDLTREIDLVEEAARLFGYDNIVTAPRINLGLRDEPVVRDLSDDARDYLSSAGFREIVTNSMTLREDAALTEPNPVMIANPLSNDMTALRSSLLPGVLSTVKHNIFNGIESSRFYEIGTTFGRIKGADPESIEGYREEERLCVAIYGLESPVNWTEKPKNATVFTLKGEANALFHRFSLDNPRYIPYPTPTALSERPISVELNGEMVGTLGLVSTGLLKRFDIDAEVFFMDVSLDAIRKLRATGFRFRPYARYPVVRRDIAVIVDERTPISEIEGVIRGSAGPLLREIVLFDIYSGEQVGTGKKSCAFSLEFVPGEKTLEQQEIQALIGAITASLKSSLGAVLRQ